MIFQPQIDDWQLLVWSAEPKLCCDSPAGRMSMRSEGQKVVESQVHVAAGSYRLPGTLALPLSPIGLVLFAHGNGSNRHSPRNQYIARTLWAAGIATLLFDLLTPSEASADVLTGHLRVDIPLLAKRVAGALDWVRTNPEVSSLRIGCFGASTGAAAALVAAAERPGIVRAVVSPGGRPDLAGNALGRVRASTLFLVGERDPHVLVLNRQALMKLRVRDKALWIIKGATHLFEEPGTLEETAQLAANWFVNHLTDPAERRFSAARIRQAEQRLP